MPESGGAGTLVALIIFMAASVWLGTLAQRVVERSSFVKGYFLGNRGLGAWAVALTATVQSGGTFMGFPSLVYSHGWVVALWIAGYMVVPITAFGIFGKRLAQLSRRTGAITVPDLIRERFGSPTAGLTASLLILFFMSAMMVAQFKAGAIVMQISWPGTESLALSEDPQIANQRAYLIGLTIFTLIVVGYTLIGGFLAAVWTDLFQSVMMLIGVVILLVLALPPGGIEQATRQAVDNLGPGGDAFAFGPGYSKDGRQFLPVGLAFSFFFMWVFGGLGSPAGMVRVMACKNTESLRKSIYLLSIYNAFIYIPLVIICISARVMMPALAKPDEVIPRMALRTTADLWGGSFVAGLILSAPFGAVMATVSTYLVVIASGLVRDIYQRFINPTASERRIRWISYSMMVVVGLIAVGANIKPVDYLQAIVVFSGTCAGATFVVPAFMAAFWRRATAGGVMAAMLAGVTAVLGLYVAGWTWTWRGYDQGIGVAGTFRPYFLLGLDPIVWGLAVSLIAGIVGSIFTKPVDSERVSLFFDAQPAEYAQSSSVSAS
ncbi:MAG: sodium:solute symporter [Methanobacteriota archaeon]|nr:MAG: sodium:solute symporter [Euryarchaeota archaeon]